MDPRLQRRVQRYGWDRAVTAYEEGWRAQLEPAHSLMLDMAASAAWRARARRRLRHRAGQLPRWPRRSALGARSSAPTSRVRWSRRRAASLPSASIANARFERSDAEALPFADGSFDAAVCGLGLMYVPDPVKALGEMRRLLRPGGRAAAAVWGARRNCGWAEIFPITDARVASEVCPMFFQLGTQDMLARSFAAAGFTDIRFERLLTTLRYATPDDALGAVFRGGPVALAYSRFDDATRRAVHAEYLDSIAAFRAG